MERDQIIVEAPFLKLPIELIIIIISLLSESRDKVKLRYVSKRLRVVSETPSLWREFVWDYYDTREELCVKNVLKRCGEHIKLLAFPGYLTPKLDEMLQYCNNVRHVSLPVVTRLSPDQLAQLGEAVQHMKHLHTLDIGWDSNDIKPLLLIATATNLQVLTLYSGLAQFKLLGVWVNEWALDMQFRPVHFNIVLATNYQLARNNKVDEQPEIRGLVQNWQLWNSKVPHDHIANFKLYEHFKTPLNLYSIVPIFQLQFSQTAFLPFVQAEQCGIQDLDCLQLTDCCKDGKMMYKATTTSFTSPQYNSTITSLRFLTQYNATKCDSLSPCHLEQLAIACPNLQQLVLSGCIRCLISLDGLRAIASHCHNLQGLNIMGIPVTELESQIEFWETLSNLKLTNLIAEYCIIVPFVAAPKYKKKLICLYQKCSSLVALESKFSVICRSCGIMSNKGLILSQFPSLSYLMIHIGGNFKSPQDIITSCKEVKCFRIHSSIDPATLTHVCNNNLQQLFLLSRKCAVLDSFMSSVSAHGGLVHVLLYIASVSVVGISVLIENSPKLITFCTILEIHHENSVETLTEKEFEEFEHFLRQKYPKRKVFNMGGFVMLQKSKHETRAQFLDSLSLGYTDLQVL